MAFKMVSDSARHTASIFIFNISFYFAPAEGTSISPMQYVHACMHNALSFLFYFFIFLIPYAPFLICISLHMCAMRLNDLYMVFVERIQ